MTRSLVGSAFATVGLHGLVLTAAELEPSQVLDRGDGITRGTFLNCWSPEMGLTAENCCGGKLPCFDDFFTEGRCCRQTPAVGDEQCLRLARASLERCLRGACDENGVAFCDELIETPQCGAHCKALPAANTSTVTRSSMLGRALWCLGRRADVRVALDLFLGEGDGSGTLLAHSLARDTKEDDVASPLGILMGFERDAESYAQAVRWFSQFTWVEVSSLEAVSGGALKLDTSALQPRDGKRLTALLFSGEPYEDPSSAFKAEERKHSALRSLCEQQPVDLLFLDPAGTSAEVEFLEVLDFCKPLRWVVVNNANLPGHAGWVREHLLGLGGDWAEVLTGQTSDPWGAGKQTWLRDLYRSRSWTVLARSSALCS